MTNIGHFGEPFFLEDPDKLDDPFADLARYRRECPVYFNPTLGQWFVFRYDDVATLFRDQRLSADRMSGFIDQAPAEVREDLRSLAPMFATWVLMLDGDDHTRIRHLLNLGFNATAVQALVPAIRRSAEQLLDEVRDGKLDVAADFAFLLPAYVLSDFLGVAAADRHRIVNWSVDFVDFFNIFPITSDTTQRMMRSAREMEAYTYQMLEERRTKPRDDFVGILLRSADQTGEPTPEEIAGNAMLLLLAGHIAVRNLVGNAVYLLLTHPAERRRLADDPALLGNLVEETLRFEPPVTLIPRVALSDITIGGVTIPSGAVVQLSIAAANRDPAHFVEPDRFDIGRKPQRNLSFGLGPHGCLGAHLARLQSEIALDVLLQRYHRIETDPTRPTRWYRTAGNRGPEKLPLVCGN